MPLVLRFLLAALATLPAAALSLLSGVALFGTDALWLIFGRKSQVANRMPDSSGATIVIPNWNGRDLLDRYLPSVLEAASRQGNVQVMVVDNGSEDGSAEFVRERFPEVNLVALAKNLGFGGGCNHGVGLAKHDVVVLLNSDMRVEPDFLAPLLKGFSDPDVFAVSCQIFLSDPAKVREETGLTHGQWHNGGLQVGHRIDSTMEDLYPCFYGGGGSCAFDRRKMLELGGFDELFRPFYLEDTDLGYLAWKRGWKVLYCPQSVVFHEHRGTIGRKFSRAYIDSVVRANFILWGYKNIHAGSAIGSQLLADATGSVLSVLIGNSRERTNLRAQWRAFTRLHCAVRSRWRAHALATISDEEAFRRPQGGFYRDRFLAPTQVPERPAVLFLSPYPICPPVHGGAVFMLQTLRELSQRASVHLIVLLDREEERAAHRELEQICVSVQYLVRMTGGAHFPGSILPHAVLEFANAELRWLVHRTMYQRAIDVVQIEYTQLAQYGERYQRLACVLFEHDIYFQSIDRALRTRSFGLDRVRAAYEYLRALRYERRMLPRFDQVQVCSTDNGDYLRTFFSEREVNIRSDLRAGIRASDYRPQLKSRAARTLLFLGSFRHEPNLEAVQWFTRHVLPLVRSQCEGVRLLLIGSDPPDPQSLPSPDDCIEWRGFVEDIQEPLRSATIFVCPILSGSGIRVKLLEAFACGIPVVSTRVGAEGLAHRDGELCRLADDPASFAKAVCDLLLDPDAAMAMAARARAEVEQHWDIAARTEALAASYRELLASKRLTGMSGSQRR